MLKRGSGGEIHVSISRYILWQSHIICSIFQYRTRWERNQKMFWGVWFWGFSVDFGLFVNIFFFNRQDRIHFGGLNQESPALKRLMGQDEYGYFILFSLKLLSRFHCLVSVLCSLCQRWCKHQDYVFRKSVRSYLYYY